MRESIRVYVQNARPREYQLVVHGGKLYDDWANVANHCFVQSVAAEVLSDLLGLPNHDRLALAATAACHDWKKRLEKRPDDFTKQERSDATSFYLPAAAFSQQLIDALNPSFLLRVEQGKAMFLELIQFLLDDMTMGDRIVPFEDRIAEVSARNPHPDDEVEKQLGRPFWDVERNVAADVEDMVHIICQVRNMPCGDLARFINDRLNERFGEE